MNRQVAQAATVFPFSRVKGPLATRPHFWQGTDWQYMTDSFLSKVMGEGYLRFLQQCGCFVGGLKGRVGGGGVVVDDG